MADSPDMAAEKRRGRGAPAGNLNPAKHLAYAKDIETRVDGRSLLGQGLSYHRDQYLSLFGVKTLDELHDPFEREGVRRQTKRVMVRELCWGRVQTAIEKGDVEAFDALVQRLQDAIDREERSEIRLQQLVDRHHQRRSQGPTLAEYLAQRAESAQAIGASSDVVNGALSPTSHEN